MTKKTTDLMTVRSSGIHWQTDLKPARPFQMANLNAFRLVGGKATRSNLDYLLKGIQTAEHGCKGSIGHTHG